MGLGKQLLVTLVDNGTVLRTRYVLVRGNTVVAEGECSPGELPRAAEARAAFFSRSGYFDRAEVEVRNIRTLPFQARRVVEGALAFNEPFKVRFASFETKSGRQRLDLAAAPDTDIRLVLESLPTLSVPFTRLALAETSIASLVSLETAEPVTVLWMRGGVLVGMLVEKGIVLARSADRPIPGGDELEARLERVRGVLASAARRFFPEREVTLVLAFGELAKMKEDVAEANTPSRAIEGRLTKRFPGAKENTVLVWPELYGLTAVPANYSLLEPGYQEEATVSRYATLAGVLLLIGGAAAVTVASLQYIRWQASQNLYVSRNAQLASDYEAIKHKLPTPEQLAALEQSMRVQTGVTDFRVDSFLSWVSSITPDGALIRHLGVSKSGVVPAGSLSMTIEWEVLGDYASAERLTAGLLTSLGTRAKLSDSKLEYKPGHNAKFVTVLAPAVGAFRE